MRVWVNKARQSYEGIAVDSAARNRSHFDDGVALDSDVRSQAVGECEVLEDCRHANFLQKGLFVVQPFLQLVHL